MDKPKHILPVIVVSQFFCTSLWFAGNGVMQELVNNFSLDSTASASLTSAVQFGFILGTLVFAILSIADRHPPSRVFFFCALLGATFNLGILINTNTYGSILAFRFFTGFFLAGIYPVGMKIAADYYEKGLGRSMGFLVGALVIGTALPHLLKELKGELPWGVVILATSMLALIGGLLMLMLVPNGPYRKSGQKIKLLAIPTIFQVRKFRIAAFGYFGHMWELYAFWAFVPMLFKMYSSFHPGASFNIPKLSFMVIGIGGVACIFSGYISQKSKIKRVTSFILLLSGLCCITAPFIFKQESEMLFILFLLFWGMVVIADSPLFSTMVAQNAPPELKGTALTIVNSIGFLLTIISIQLLNSLWLKTHAPGILTLLGIGPAVGLIGLFRKKAV